MALGLSRKKVVALFMMEAVVIGLVGAILGAALGGWYSHHLAEVGVPIPDMDLEEGAIPVPSVIYFYFSYGLIALSVGVGLGITLVSAIFPSWKCSAVDPVAALREE
jgi:ABC-type lipoprotein release transport system permease subunit